HETELEEHAVFGDGRLHLLAFADVERERLLAEDGLLRGGGGEDDLAVELGRRHDDDRIERGVGEHLLVARKALGAGLGDGGPDGFGLHIAHGVEPGPGQAVGEILGVKAAETTQTDHADVEWLVHGSIHFGRVLLIGNVNVYHFAVEHGNQLT